MTQENDGFLRKSIEALEGASNEFLNRRYNNAVNRAYYATFHSAIHALQQAGLRARGDQWGHDYVAAQFDGVLINRRHLYPVELRAILIRNMILRISADYHEDAVTRTESERALRRATVFVTAIMEGGDRR